LKQKLSHKKNAQKLTKNYAKTLRTISGFQKYTNIQVFHLKIKITVIAGETESQKKSVVKHLWHLCAYNNCAGFCCGNLMDEE
jgi:hypothetical protein